MFSSRTSSAVLRPANILLDNLMQLRAVPRLSLQSCSVTSATSAEAGGRRTPSSKNDILADYSNHNPRNNELLRLSRQPQGYDLDVRHLYYWNRLELRQSGRYLNACVRQASGKVVLKASTREWPLQCRLPSTQDHAAVVALGKVLARRCLEAGYSELGVDPALEGEQSAKAKAFLEVVHACGVRLAEDFQLHETDMYSWALERPTLPWEVPEHLALADSAAPSPPTQD